MHWSSIRHELSARGTTHCGPDQTIFHCCNNKAPISKEMNMDGYKVIQQQEVMTGYTTYLHVPVSSRISSCSDVCASEASRSASTATTSSRDTLACLSCSFKEGGMRVGFANSDGWCAWPALCRGGLDCVKQCKSCRKQGAPAVVMAGG